MHMLLDVDTEEFIKAFDKGVTRNTSRRVPCVWPESAWRISTPLRVPRQAEEAGRDRPRLVPRSRGLVLTLNGAPRGAAVAGDDIYAALLRIFIGDRPVDREMKIGLLGGPVG